MAEIQDKQVSRAVSVFSGAIEETAVLRRMERRSKLSEITSNSSIAAAAMVLAAIIAVLVANTPAYEPLRVFIEQPLSVGIGQATVQISIEQFVNDFLMAFFFMLVGVELKYEMTVGQLRHPRQAALPMLAACGGVVVPAACYLVFNWGGLAQGWATPIATDIAFALGVMSLLGDRVAYETKVFFQTLAIADDILAIVVLALFYGQAIDIVWVLASIAAIDALLVLNRMKVYSLKPYMIVGALLWLFMFNSGIHATLAGVIIAFFLPAQSDVRVAELNGWLGNQAESLEDDYDDEAHILGQHDFTEIAWTIERVLHHVTPPLQRLERNATVPVNFLVLPIFAFVNAQVRVVGVDMGALLSDPVALGVFIGAVVGKPVGIVGTTFILVKSHLFRLPRRVSWSQIIAVGIMGGIGFTMSILIAGLAFSGPEIIAAKCAILAAAAVASVLGLAYVALVQLRESRKADAEAPWEG